MALSVLSTVFFTAQIRKPHTRRSYWNASVTVLGRCT
jgi:hypothetical protein